MSDSGSSDPSQEGTGPVIYRFVVRGALPSSWGEWFGGLEILPGDDGPGTSIVLGAVADQAELHGILTRIRDLGLPLLAVARVPSEPGSPIQRRE